MAATFFGMQHLTLKELSLCGKSHPLQMRKWGEGVWQCASFYLMSVPKTAKQAGSAAQMDRDRVWIISPLVIRRDIISCIFPFLFIPATWKPRQGYVRTSGLGQEKKCTPDNLYQTSITTYLLETPSLTFCVDLRACVLACEVRTLKGNISTSTIWPFRCKGELVVTEPESFFAKTYLGVRPLVAPSAKGLSLSAFFKKNI